MDKKQIERLRSLDTTSIRHPFTQIQEYDKGTSLVIEWGEGFLLSIALLAKL